MGYILRAWQLSDAKDLAAALSNKNVLNNLRDGLPYPYTEKDAEDYINAMLSADPEDTFAYAIRIDGKSVGSIGAFRRSNPRPHGGAGLLRRGGILGLRHHDGCCPPALR